MEQISLNAMGRDKGGKCPSGRLRSAGRVPAVLYGAGIKGSIMLSLDYKELDKVLHTGAGANVLVNLAMEGDKKPKTVMFKEISRHPLSGSIEHIDFIEVLMDRKVSVDVPVHIVGKAAGTEMGGIVQLETRKIKIECLPAELPDSIDVDVTPLGIGQSLHVRDMKLSEGIRVLEDPDATIVSIVAPTAEVVSKTAEEVQAELAKSFEEKEEPAKEGAVKEAVATAPKEEKEKEKEKEKKKK